MNKENITLKESDKGFLFHISDHEFLLRLEDLNELFNLSEPDLSTVFLCYVAERGIEIKNDLIIDNEKENPLPYNWQYNI